MVTIDFYCDLRVAWALPALEGVTASTGAVVSILVAVSLAAWWPC